MYVSMALRFVSGAGDTMVQITFYNILTEIYTDNIGMVFRYMEIVVNVGLAVGPILGASLIETLDYNGTMYLFGAVNGLCMILCIFMIPKSMNKGSKTPITQTDDPDELEN